MNTYSSDEIVAFSIYGSVEALPELGHEAH
jgi:hypothetical protein